MYQLHEVGPQGSPQVSGWRLGRVTAFPQPGGDLQLAVWPRRGPHPMAADWERYKAGALAGAQVRASLSNCIVLHN